MILFAACAFSFEGNAKETAMAFIWLGALLILAGVVYMAGQAIWRGPLSARRQMPVAGATLEPPNRGLRIFGLARNWPGLAMIALGAIFLFAGAAAQVPVQ
jgi:hypothetical protein